jgi:hypothetical protein
MGATRHVGVLGAARFVLPRSVERADLSRDKAMAHADLTAFLAIVDVLEPTEIEVRVATEMELVAQRDGLPLHAGESQLGAIVIERAIAALETGDKRAIHGIERLLDRLEKAWALRGKVRCFEQIVVRAIAQHGAFAKVAAAIYSEPHVDKAMSICFGCYSDRPATRADALEGLQSYIETLRSEAPRALVP